jgi:hypothetical protein
LGSKTHAFFAANMMSAASKLNLFISLLYYMVIAVEHHVATNMTNVVKS